MAPRAFAIDFNDFFHLLIPYMLCSPSAVEKTCIGLSMPERMPSGEGICFDVHAFSAHVLAVRLDLGDRNGGGMLGI